MSTLTGNKIKDTYTGLLKTSDNAPVTATLKAVEDGAGNAVPIQISTTEVAFTGAVDFSTAAVSGLPEPGLVNGVGTNSVKSSDSLTANASQTNGNASIALGNGAKANGSESVAIGDFAEASQTGCAAVGQYAEASATYASAWGRTSYARADGAVAFGQQAGVPPGVNGGVAIGRQVVADLSDTCHVRALKVVAPDGGTGGNGITLLSPDGTAGVITLTNASELAVDGTPIGGGGAAGLVAGGNTGSQKSADALSDGANSATGYRSIAIGSGNQANASVGVAIGNYTRAGNNAVAIGDNANTTYGAKTSAVSIGQGANAELNAVAIGKSALATVDSAVALGNGVTASRTNTTTVKELEIQTVGNGVIMYSPDGTAYKLTVANGGTLTVTAI